MRTNPNEARTRPNDISRGGSCSTAARGSSAAKTDQTDRGVRLALEGIERFGEDVAPITRASDAHGSLTPGICGPHQLPPE
jgi:hypothetical protein